MKSVAMAVFGSALALLLVAGSVTRAEDDELVVVDVPMEEVLPNDEVVVKPDEPPMDDGDMVEEQPWEDWIRYFEDNPPGENDEDLIFYTMVNQRGDMATENPEPSSMILAGVGSALASLYLWRRRRA